MRGKWFLAGATVILLAIAAGALSVLWRKPAPPPARSAAAAPLAPGAEISLSGRVEAQNVVDVPAPIDGTIDEYLVEPGEDVFEGQLLARIRNEGLESARELARLELDRTQTRMNNLESYLLSARLEASRARADASRAQEETDRLERIHARQAFLLKEGATPRLVFEKAQKEYQDAEIESTALKARADATEERAGMIIKDLDNTRKLLEDKNKTLEGADSDLQAAQVHSPVDGIVLSRHGQAGENVTPETRSLLRIATDLSSLLVVLEPEPPVLERIAPGQPAWVILTELGNEPVQGSVKEIRGADVIVEFVNPSPAVRPGLTAQVRIKLT